MRLTVRLSIADREATVLITVMEQRSTFACPSKQPLRQARSLIVFHYPYVLVAR